MQILLEGWEDGEAVTAHLRDLDRAQVQAAEHLTLQLPGKHGVVTLQQRPGGSSSGTTLGVGACAWDSALVLAAYLASLPPGSLAGKWCVELGAGVGIVGLVAARLGAQAVLTDRRPLLSLLRGNAARNWLAGTPDPRSAAGAGDGAQPTGRAEVAALDWGAPDRAEVTARLAQPPRDYIFAADCCYVDPGGPTPDPQQFVDTAAELAGPHTQLLMAHEIRPHGDVWPALEAACRKAFSSMERVPLDGLPDGFTAPHIQLWRLRL